jgi:hypothetical protein
VKQRVVILFRGAGGGAARDEVFGGKLLAGKVHPDHAETSALCAWHYVCIANLLDASTPVEHGEKKPVAEVDFLHHGDKLLDLRSFD